MTKGWISKSSRSGAVYAEAPIAVRGKSEIIRPGTFGDGLPQGGVPAGRESTRASSSRYEDKESHKYRADYRGDEARGLTGGLEGRGTDPTVHSKSTRRYGHDGSRLPNATYRSTGHQPAPQQRDEVAPSSPHRSQPRATEHSERVGFPGGGAAFREATHPNSRRHGLDGIHHPDRTTDDAPGMANSASGGRFGEPQKRPPQRTVQAEKPGDSGALNRREYIRGK